jgi:hypothetical protein
MGTKKVSLNPKQEKFLAGILAGLTQRKAYIEAYPNSKTWKDNAIDVKASQLFSNDKIKLRYHELLQSVTKKSILQREEVLEILSSVVRGNIADYLKEDGTLDVPKIRENKPLLSEITTSRGGLKAKFADPLVAIEKIAKLLGWNEPEKIQHEFKGPSNIVFGDTSKRAD